MSLQNLTVHTCVLVFLQECDKKETDYATKSTDLKKKYESTCKQLGIQVSYVN
jgi:hypothetical protein